MNKTFSIYRSSAGSGKTRTLAREYLKLALRFRADYFKHILAVTFTNKATQEMKDRILAYLDDFTNGRPSDLAEELKKELGLDDITFRQHSQEAQASILHKYAQFSISTIDAFFQKVIRSFTRESGLVGDYRLEIEQDAVLEEVIDNLIDELGNDKELTNWVVEFAKENLENERAWDVRYSLIEFSKETFKEDFKLIEDDVVSVTRQKDFFKNLLSELRQRKYGFLNFVKGRANEALDIVHSNGLKESDFKYGGGVYNFFAKQSKLNRVSDFKEKGVRPEREFQSSKNWPDKDTPHAGRIVQLADQQLIPLLNEILEHWNRHFKQALSAELALNNFYAFGLIADISRKLREYKDENNMMLLADAPKFLNGVIRDSDTPFIYEKVGSFYRNYLIDEFQDTSGLQWMNFLPLLTNSLDQGYSSLVVGDVKQAIYRWRGGDLSLLQELVEQQIGRERVEVRELDSNYRSAVKVVDFNNAIFETAASWIAAETGHPIATEAYKDVAQKVSKKEEGFVQVRFLTESSPDDKWKDQAMDLIPASLERLQEAGVPLKDIAILVRKNDEGQQIVAHLLQYRNSDRAKPNCRYDVISNESLRLDGAATINLLLAAMKYLLNPQDAIARAQLAYEFARLYEPGRMFTEVFAVSEQVFFESNLPDGFTKQKGYLKKLPLFELTETLIGIFNLGNVPGELAYLQAFQTLVLDFYTRERNDLGAFLEWWEDNKHNKSIKVSGEIDAVQILTIHKSKGLQFKYVLIPFCAWGLDHDTWRAPNLWVRSEEAPFKDAGYLPVKYASTLELSYFDAFYKEEHTRSYLDNLNLLYVALTRAEHGLIITAPHPDIKNIKKTVAQVVYESIQRSEVLGTYWNPVENIWMNGEWSTHVPTKSHHEGAGMITLQTYNSAAWRNKLVIRQSANGYFEEAENAVREKIYYGVHMHAVLSRIRYLGELGETLDKMSLEGLITNEERKPLEEQLQNLFRDEQIASWFSEAWEVRTEIPVLLPGGDESRIDRLLTHEKAAIVIDFKTGEPVKADQEQVLNYMNILRQMNFFEVEGYLLYVRSGEVFSVKSGKPKTAKKKDEQQLGLGI